MALFENCYLFSRNLCLFSTEFLAFFLHVIDNLFGYYWQFSLMGDDMKTVILLTVSNVFMTFAWYGHLRYKDSALWKVILVSWLIAFAEYCFQVPANRIGHYQFSAAQLKIIQEVITLIVFAVFSLFYLKEDLKWNYLASFAMMAGAVFFMFRD